MADERWASLLGTPYDDKGRTRDRKSGRWLWFLGASLGAGLLFGWLIATVSADDTTSLAGSTTTTAIASTTTFPASVTDEGILVGHSRVGATAFGVLGSFQSGETTFVIVSEIVGVDTDRTATPRETVGSWDLVTDAATVPMTADTRAVLSPGLSLLSFETIATAEELRFTPSSDVGRNSSCTVCDDQFSDASDGDIDLGDTTLPTTVEEPSLAITLTDDVSVVIDAIQLGEDSGAVEWHTEGPTGALVAVEFFVTYAGATDPDTGVDTSLGPVHLIGQRFGQSQVPVAPQPAREGTAELGRTGPPIPVGTVTVRPILRWHVSWVFPVGESTSVPVR
jgi:hypothetical protein